jgi:hypothetical protein
MARVHFVKSARKDYPEHDIKKGESYYWWALKTGPRSSIKRKSKTAPRPSQLTTSEFKSALYEAQEAYQDAIEAAGEFADIEAAVNDYKETLEGLQSEQEEKRSNMPEGLQDSGTGELLQGRYDSLQELIDELEGLDIPNDDDFAKEDCPECHGEGTIDNQEATGVECGACEGEGQLENESFDDALEDCKTSCTNPEYQGE